jgi:diguanylate cyclase (GGDEF)-like protein
VQGCLGRTRPSKEVAGVVLLLITIVGGANWLLSTQSSRSTVTSLAAIVCSILTLRELAGPGRRFWGPRLVAVAQLMCVVLNLHIMMRSGQVEQVPWAEALVIDMLFALLGTTGMLLWTQERVRNQLAQTAITDALTGALNRHGLVPYLERELAKAQRTERPVSVVLCDLDHFKAVNDVHGHDVGDAVLKLFVDRATASIRTGDVLGRWGGEEFLFVLPETAVGDAVQVAERLRQSLRRPELGLPAVTVSAGVATAARNTGYDLKTLLSVADRHLYLAKETRDRVVAQTTAKRAVQRGAESGREYAAASAS